jgi:hypothetical protein
VIDGKVLGGPRRFLTDRTLAALVLVQHLVLDRRDSIKRVDAKSVGASFSVLLYCPMVSDAAWPWMGSRTLSSDSCG